MTVPDCLRRFGLHVQSAALPEIRLLLEDETRLETERQGRGDTGLMKLFAVQLFGVGELDDVLRIWAAKTASMDSDGSIDVQLLCGAGLNVTKAFLGKSPVPAAAVALKRILACEDSGDFIDFSPEALRKDYEDYYAKALQ